MSLRLYFHPLSSFCQKVLVALYENDTAFEPHLVDLGDEAASAELRKLWPAGKIPVLRDDARERTVPESSIIIEYLAQHYPGRTPLVSAHADLARQTRLRDRFYDLHVNVPMQKIVTDSSARRATTIRTAWSRRRRCSRPPTEWSRPTWQGRRGRWATRSPWPTAPPGRRCTTPTWSCPSASAGHTLRRTSAA